MAKICLLFLWILSCTFAIPKTTKAESEPIDTSLNSHKIFFPLVIKQIRTTYYVSSTGMDTNPGTLEKPFKTIQRGIEQLVPGDTLFVRGGIYSEKIKIKQTASPSLPITISSFPGETAIIDGNGLEPNNIDWSFLVSIYGQNIIFQNFELTYPQGYGVWITQTASHNIIRNLNVHHFWGNGIGVYGSNTLVENNKVWKTNLSYDPDSYPGGNWGGAIFFGDSTQPNYGQNTIIRNNEVFQNYGEGILCMYTKNGLIEGNRVWDNWAAGIYPDQCSYIDIISNIVYHTTDHEYWNSDNRPAAGIYISNEGIIPNYPIGHNRNVYNNIVINSGLGIDFYTGYVSGSRLINDVIANNTIVINGTTHYGIIINAPYDLPHENTIIANNIVGSNNSGTLGKSMSNTGLTFTNNLWSSVPDVSVSGLGDIVANPLLEISILSMELNLSNNLFNANLYKLTSSSPAINKAIPFDVIVKDFYNSPRDNNPDIGAHEFLK